MESKKRGNRVALAAFLILIVAAIFAILVFSDGIQSSITDLAEKFGINKDVRLQPNSPQPTDPEGEGEEDGNGGLGPLSAGTITIERIAPELNLINVSQNTTYEAIFRVNCTGGDCGVVEVAVEYATWPYLPYNGDFETGDTSQWTHMFPLNPGAVGHEGQEGPLNYSAYVNNFAGFGGENSGLTQRFTAVDAEGVRVYHLGDIASSATFILEVFNDVTQSWIVIESFADAGNGDIEFPNWTERNYDLSSFGVSRVSGARIHGFRSGFDAFTTLATDKICLTDVNGACILAPRLLVSDTVGDTPFYTLQMNPQFTRNLSNGEQEIILFDVNATGTIGANWTFQGRANNTPLMLETERWKVVITNETQEEQYPPTCHKFLETPGEIFTLTGNVFYNETCLIVTANDVEINGAGFSINGNQNDDHIGILVKADNAEIRNAGINNFGTGVNFNSQAIDFCSAVGNGVDSARAYYTLENNFADASFIIKVNYFANFAGGMTSDKIFLGDSGIPIGKGIISIPLTQNGAAIIDNVGASSNVPGIHLARGQDTNGTFIDITHEGNRGGQSMESIKFETFFVNSEIVNLLYNGENGRLKYDNPVNGSCGIVENPQRDAQNDDQADDEITFFSNSTSGGLVRDSTFNGNTERVIGIKGFNHVFRNLNIVNSLGDVFVFRSGGNTTIQNSIVTGTQRRDIEFLNSLSGRTYIIDTSLRAYQFASNLVTLRTTNTGEIEFLQPVTGFGTNLSNDVKIRNNFVETRDAQQGLNRTANITLWNVPGFTNPSILRNGLSCGSLCTAYTPLNANPVKFRVQSWTNYSIGENPVAYSLEMSPELSSGIRWNVLGSGNNQHAIGNNGQNGNTLYWVNISALGTNVDLYIRADGDLISGGGDVIGLGNESFKSHLSSPIVPGFIDTSLSTNWQLVSSNLPNQQIVYFKFLLDVAQGTRAGFYENNVEFILVPVGGSPP